MLLLYGLRGKCPNYFLFLVFSTTAAQTYVMDTLGQFERHLILLWGTLTRHRRCVGKSSNPHLHIHCRMNKESNADHYMCDSQASIVGRRIGRLRWCSVFGKTVEGSVAFFFSVLGASWIMWLFGIVDDFNVRSSKSFFPPSFCENKGQDRNN